MGAQDRGHPDADAMKGCLPRGGAAKVLVTLNAHAWRGVEAPVEIQPLPKQIGADYLIVRCEVPPHVLCVPRDASTAVVRRRLSRLRSLL